MPDNISWIYGENDQFQYHEAYVGKDYLCVYCNKSFPNTWLGMINKKLIGDKVENTKQIEAEQARMPSYMAHPGYSDRWTAVCRDNAEDMKAIVVECYCNGTDEH